MSEDDSNDGFFDRIAEMDDSVLMGAGILLLILVVGLAVVFGGSGAVLDNGDTTSSEVEGFNFPSGAHANGIDNPMEMGVNHTNAVTEDSYTLEASVVDESGQESSLEYRYDGERNVALGTQQFGDGLSQSYENFDEQEQFIAEGLDTDNTTYNRFFLQQGPFTGEQEFMGIIAQVEVQAVDVVEAPDGEDAVVYDIQGINQTDTQTEGSDVNVTGEMHLSENGHFVYLDVTIEQSFQGQELTSTQEVTIYDVGQTEFDDPEWLSEAQEQTDEVEEPEQDEIPIEPEPPEEDSSDEDEETGEDDENYDE